MLSCFLLNVLVCSPQGVRLVELGDLFFDVSLLLWGCTLVWLTQQGLCSAYVPMLMVAFPLATKLLLAKEFKHRGNLLDAELRRRSCMYEKPRRKVTNCYFSVSRSLTEIQFVVPFGSGITVCPLHVPYLGGVWDFHPHHGPQWDRDTPRSGDGFLSDPGNRLSLFLFCKHPDIIDGFLWTRNETAQWCISLSVSAAFHLLGQKHKVDPGWSGFSLHHHACAGVQRPLLSVFRQSWCPTTKKSFPAGPKLQQHTQKDLDIFCDLMFFTFIFNLKTITLHF